MPYISVSHLRIADESAPALLAAFAKRAHLVEEADGFERLEVWQGSSDPGEVVMVSWWRDRAAFTQYMKSDAHAVSHNRIPTALQEEITLERLEHLQGYELMAT